VPCVLNIIVTERHESLAFTISIIAFTIIIYFPFSFFFFLFGGVGVWVEWFLFIYLISYTKVEEYIYNELGGNTWLLMNDFCSFCMISEALIFIL
jgi:hypothetical protein